MFGISFSELLLVGLVALLVLGPERLPGAARTAGLWVGRLKRSFNAIKQEVEREIGADEIRRQLHNEHILSLEQEARKILSPVQEPAPAVAEQTIHPVAAPSLPGEPLPGDLPSTTVPASDAVPVLGAVEPAPHVPTPSETAVPAPTPSAPASHDPTLPPRAP
ncbi:Sec-independent protein translocase protein TatB [Pseudomonas gingeri]|uniref:Sec-independent protein translocase protein TatB n=1 Tax=Pseudomonas gingeri TaxID=117681 RepID=A0A7Y7YEK8_9PSED|nr:Sec-independent protein translocase protein TatB [Pseudomonas gingeri]NWA00345.1 Sec-independent protein translocase subunit TatB [Pseudomonas gingeri]NWA14941.1 Sec-independent protein translocase subunit TatB [Pseudomonas gingeri]NWA57977.1 Sec-independent protein translocase subunit TatB [Pseudomonas gingeri]NWA96925.1 Sec-independent protein translocase subunit TatB [Pseudomonas gingeri]NWB03755.1 Sec-independent protein translocase subunit TatB [Pseudomonas gingeri]